MRIIYILLLFVGSLSSQSLPKFYVQNKDYSGAIHSLYFEIFKSEDIQKKAELYYEIAQLYKQNNQLLKAKNTITNALNLPNIKNKGEFRYLKATILMAIKKWNEAEFELLRASMFSSNQALKSKSNILLFLLYVHSEQWNKAVSQSKKLDKHYDTVRKQILTVTNLPFKSEKKAKWLSTFLPGAGQLYGHDFKEGINALVVNSATIYLMTESILLGEYLDLMITDITFFWRYYQGNRRNAEHSVHHYNHNLTIDFQKQIIQTLILESSPQEN
jgi:hypothetical protein